LTAAAHAAFPSFVHIQEEEDAGDAEEGSGMPEPKQETATAVADGADEEAVGAAVAGGAVAVDDADEAAVCGNLFSGLIFFLGCAQCSSTIAAASWNAFPARGR
jgi:hypothetical protein